MLKTDKMKKFLSAKSGVIFIVLLLLLAISSFNFFVVANNIVVTIHDGASVYTVNTRVQTVDRVLEQQGIELKELDRVEPSLDTKLLADSTIIITRTNRVRIADGETVTEVLTTKTGIRSILEESGITLGQYDKTTPALDGQLDDTLTISIKRAVTVLFNHFGTGQQGIATTADNVADFMAEQGITFGETDYCELEAATPIVPGLEINTFHMESYVEETVEAIPFETVRRANSALTRGETKVVTAGVNGERVVRTMVVTRNGEVSSTQQLSAQVVKNPTTKVVEYGTKAITAASRSTVTRAELANARVINVVATAYCGGGTTASGLPAAVGRVAVDPQVIPMGTRMYIETSDGSIVYGYAVAADTGGAIKGNKIDLYYNTYQECINFGRRNCKVYILD